MPSPHSTSGLCSCRSTATASSLTPVSPTRPRHPAHPTLDVVDVYAATIPSLDFKPEVHVNYAETVLPMRDGLPKLKDFPAELGSSGEAVAE